MKIVKSQRYRQVPVDQCPGWPGLPVRSCSGG